VNVTIDHNYAKTRVFGLCLHFVANSMRLQLQSVWRSWLRICESCSFGWINTKYGYYITPFKVIQGHRFRYRSKAHI